MHCVFDMSNLKSSESASKKGIIASGFLAVVEVTGGLLSGSLGLLSSSFNTLTDFFASIIMLVAVRESNRPPDEVHMYGHEKIESAAAVAEVLLLVAACSWIVYNAFLRIVANEQKIEFFWAAFFINFISIAIDFFAYKKLKSSVKEQRSEAIEAGALHFLNDLLIAAVVIIGLVFYNFGIWIADSIAALCIVTYVLFSGIKILRESYESLIDVAPPGISKKLKDQILSVEGVKDCHHLRVRRAGRKHFVDAHVILAGGLTLYQAQSVTSTLEERILQILPNSDVMIHTEPHSGKDPASTIRAIASQIPEIRDLHGITVKNIEGKLLISFHIELDSKITIASAHEITNNLEQRLKEELKDISTIITHLEPVPEMSGTGYCREPAELLEREVARISQTIPEVQSLHDLEILTRDGKYNVTLHCAVDSFVTLAKAHEIATKIEEKIKAIDSRITQVSVHCEPKELA